MAAGETTDTLSTVGYKRIVRFKTTPADALRIHFTEQKARYVLIMWKPSWLPRYLEQPALSVSKCGK